MAPPERRGARALQVIAGLAVSAALVWWAFHDTDFSSLWSRIRGVRLIPLLAAVAVATAPFLLRVPRWRLLLRHDDGRALPSGALWHAIAIGFAANNVLPLRAGEVLRVAAVSRLGPVSFASALSSVAVERVIDALTVVALMSSGLLLGSLPATVTLGGSTPAAVIAQRTGIVCLVALLVAIAAAWRRDLALRWIERLTPSGRAGAALVRFADHLLSGLGALRDPRRALPVIGWSLIIWLVNASAFFVAFKAFDFQVPFAGALVLQGALMVGIAVPSTPGYVGVFESVIPAVLLLYGVDKGSALACAVAYHVTTFIPITFLGALSAVRTGTRLRAPAATP